MTGDPRNDTAVDDAWHKAIEAETPEDIDEAQAEWMRLRDEEKDDDDSITETHN